jgi:hypothetical protein
MSKEVVIDNALVLHPGEVETAYRETQKGVEVWEVKITGEDDNAWESYYRLDNGELFMWAGLFGNA